MILINSYVSLVVGLLLLLISGDFLVKAAVSLASHLRISRLVIGFTVVSFGTSAPELFVSTSAALSGHPDISIGNVVGSNIANIALVLAITAMIFPVPVKTNSLLRNLILLIIVSGLLYLFSITNNRQLVFYEGLVFIVVLLFFLYFSVVSSRRDGKKSPAEFASPAFPLWKSILLVLIASLGLVFGANWLVGGASGIARDLGISERVISLSVIALGTSLPELATSAMAAFRKEMDISIGNIVGSNLFNILAILGVTALITNVPVNREALTIDYWWMIGITVMLLLCILPVTGGLLKRWKATLLFTAYILYIFLIFS